MRPEWYLNSVKPKENRTWPISDKFKVFNLRENQHKSSQEIATIMGVKVTQIYNITRLVRKGKQCQCFCCGHNLSDEELSVNSDRFIKLCENCKEKQSQYKHNKRKTSLKHGLCGYCQKRPALPNKTGCIQCISASHRRRYKIGLCGVCGKNPIEANKISLCKVCSGRKG